MMVLFTTRHYIQNNINNEYPTFAPINLKNFVIFEKNCDLANYGQ